MSSKPCQFFIGDSKNALSYDEMRAHLIENYDSIMKELDGEKKRTEKKVEKKKESKRLPETEKKLKDAATMTWDEFRKVHPNEPWVNYNNYKDAATDDAQEAFAKSKEEGEVIVPSGFINVRGHLQTVSDYIQKAQSVLDVIFPGYTIIQHKTNSDYNASVPDSVANAYGAWIPGTKVIHLNMEAIASNTEGANTPIHEAIHPIVDAIYGSDEDTLNGLWDQLHKLADSEGMELVKKHFNNPTYVRADAVETITYGRETRRYRTIEGVTEFLALVAEGKIDAKKMPKSTWSKFVDVLNNILKAIGSPIRVREPNDLAKLADAISSAFKESDTSKIEKIIKRKEPLISKDLDALANMIDNDDDLTKKIKSILEKYSDIDPALIKEYLKSKTGWEQSKVNMIFNETGVAHAYTNRELENLGFDPYIHEGVEGQDALWDAEAEAKIASGYDVEGMMQKVRDGKMKLGPVEQKILGKYISKLKADIESNYSTNKLMHYREVLHFAQKIAGTEVAQLLAARRGSMRTENSLADFMARATDSNKGELTQEQESHYKKLYEQEQAAKKAYEEKVAKLEEELAKKEAESAVKETKAKATKTAKTKADFAAEKAKIKEDIKRKWKEESGKMTATVVPYANHLFRVAPDVAKYMKVLVEEGVTDIKQIISQIHADLKDAIPEVEESDVRDIIAGKYNEPKPQRKEIAEKMHNLKQEAKILAQIEAIENGEIPKTEEKKKQRNRELQDLRERLKQIKKSIPEIKASEDLEAYKSRVGAAIKKLQHQLDTGDFAKPKAVKPLELDDEAKQLRREWDELKKQKEHDLLKLEYESLSKRDKAIEFAGKLTNVPRTLMATLDASAVFIQGAIASTHTAEARGAIRKMFNAIRESNFNDYMQEIYDSPRFELMQELKLGITDPNSPFATAQEELFFARNLVDRMGDIKVFGKKPLKIGSELNKASERMYIMYLNKMRFDLFSKIVTEFEDAGMTFENEPELYKATAKYVNNITGRGNFGEKFETFVPILSGLFFSPRMIASRVSLLKSLAVGGRDLPAPLRKYFARDMAKFVGSRMAILGAIKLAALALFDDDEEKQKKVLDVEFDPRSSDFGKVVVNNTRFDVWGGFTGYARLIAQALTMERKSTKTGEIQDLSDMGAYSQTKGDLTAKFLRGKLAPLPSYLVDISTGENVIGQKVEPLERTGQLFVPLIIPSISDLQKDLGWGAIPGSAANFFGITSTTYDDSVKSFGDPVKLYNKETGEKYEATQEQMNRYVEVKDNIVTKIYDKIEKRGGKVDLDVYGDPMIQFDQYGTFLTGNQGDDKWGKTVKIDELSNKQKQELRKKISARATREAKKKVFKGLETKD